MTALRTRPDGPFVLPDGRFVVPGNRWDLLDGCEPDQPASVSVVVPYYDAQDQLDRTLAALAVQTYPVEAFEVVVADDGSPAPARLDAAGPLTVRQVRQPDRGFRAGAARNLGARTSRADVLCFLDADTIPEPDYLRRLVRLPSLTPDALVTGRRRHADFARWSPEQVRAWLSGRALGPREYAEPDWLHLEHRRSANLLDLHEGSYRFVISAVMACSRALFSEVGGFEETLTRYGGEDWELAHRAIGAGAVVAHVPSAIAWHDGPDWAHRGDAESRRREKNAETATLAALIPQPGRTDRPWSGRPDVVVELNTTDEEAATVILGVRSILAAGLDCGIWLTGPDAQAVRAQHFDADPRIHAGPVDGPPAASARVRVAMTRPLRVPVAAWPALLARVRPDRVGRVEVSTDDGRLVITSSRAYHRSRRWAGPLEDTELIEPLFGRCVLAGSPLGVRPFGRRPDLDHELAHLLDPP